MYVISGWRTQLHEKHISFHENEMTKDSKGFAAVGQKYTVLLGLKILQ